MDNKCSGCGCVGFHSLACPYLQATAWKLQNEPGYKETQARIQLLEGLVREMGIVLTNVDLTPAWDSRGECCFCARKKGHDPDCTRELSGKILNRPEVKEIMEDRETGQQESQQCSVSCPHSTFEPLHCSLAKGHSGPHHWVSSLKMEGKP